MLRRLGAKYFLVVKTLWIQKSQHLVPKNLSAFLLNLPVLTVQHVDPDHSRQPEIKGAK